MEYYVGDKAPANDHATRLEIVFAEDPFARDSIDNFERLRRELPDLLPPELAGAKWHLLGAPASIRDLKTVTDRDRAWIYGLVLVSVFAGLLVLVRRVLISAALVIVTGLGFLASLGGDLYRVLGLEPGRIRWAGLESAHAAVRDFDGMGNHRELGCSWPESARNNNGRHGPRD